MELSTQLHDSSDTSCNYHVIIMRSSRDRCCGFPGQSLGGGGSGGKFGLRSLLSLSGVRSTAGKYGTCWQVISEARAIALTQEDIEAQLLGGQLP